MEKKRYTYYQEDNILIGWLEEYPDYRTMGETLEELEENLQDIYDELKSGRIPYVRHNSETGFYIGISDSVCFYKEAIFQLLAR